MKPKKLVLMALLTAIALTIFMIEAQIPALVPIPGVKVGLANIVTVFAVFAIGPGEAAAILFVRVFLGAVFAGNFSTILYSGAGGLCAILVTILLKKILTDRQLWVAGALGAVAHSLGQMAMAVLITGTPSLVVYLPVMIAISIVTGLFTGLCAQTIIHRGGKVWKTFLR
ncbi:MAG: Gx transporter family protein [Faecousia sp.]